MQTVLVYILFFSAVVYIAYKFIPFRKKKKTSKSCGAGSCGCL